MHGQKGVDRSLRSDASSKGMLGALRESLYLACLVLGHFLEWNAAAHRLVGLLPNLFSVSWLLLKSTLAPPRPPVVEVL